MGYHHLLIFVIAPILSVSGHGNLVWPYVWQDAGGSVGLSSYGHMTIGGQILFEDDMEKYGLVSMWYTNYTFIVGEPTLEEYMKTFPNVEQGLDLLIERNPWNAPGSSPVFSGCGIAGGNPLGCPEGAPMLPGQDCGGVYKGGYSYGPRAEDFEFADVVTTEWKRGELAEVGWGMNANHGGGYSYRLCKIPEEGRSGLTEECFQRTPLFFASNEQWVQTGYDTETRIYFTANRTTKGTYPPGSEWTKNPVANCAGLGGGFFNEGKECPQGYQFPPVADGVYGQGANYKFDMDAFFEWNIMDEVIVPEDIETGDYALSFRWDCEQTPQVWNACSSIRIS